MTVDLAARRRVEEALDVIEGITGAINAGRVPDAWAVAWLKGRLQGLGLESERGDDLARLCRVAEERLLNATEEGEV